MKVENIIEIKRLKGNTEVGCILLGRNEPQWLSLLYGNEISALAQEVNFDFLSQLLAKKN